MFTTSSRCSSVQPASHTTRRRRHGADRLAAAVRRCAEQLESRRLLSTTFQVDTFDDAVADDGLTSLREAIALAAATAGDDTVQLPAGIYALALGWLTIDDTNGATAIESIGGVATIDARGQSGVLEVFAGSKVELSGLTITGGVAATGGGIYNEGTTTISGSTLTGNLATYGGGIFNDFGGTTNITACSLDGNVSGVGKKTTRTPGGGGIYNVGTATITDSTLSGNTATGASGGGIYNQGTATVTNSALNGNSATFGGGIYNAGTATVTAGTLSGNSATYGGGIFNFSGVAEISASALSDNSASGNGGGIYNKDTATITGSTLSGNTTGSNGGGIFNYGGAATITASTVSDNSAASNGGGIYSYGTVTVTASTISSNSAFSASLGGGGIYVLDGTATITDSTLSDNTANSFGGGIFIDAGTATITGSTLSGNQGFYGGAIYNLGTATITASTVSGNSAGGQGGGIYNQGAVTLGNTIVAGNGAPDGADIFRLWAFSSQGYNLIGIDDTGSFTAAGDQAGTTAVPIDPLLGSLADNGGPTLTHAPLPGSPAIDAGDPNFDPNAFSPPMITDQRGLARVSDGNDDGVARIDIGSVERRTPRGSIGELIARVQGLVTDGLLTKPDSRPLLATLEAAAGQLASSGGADGTGPLGALISILEADISRLDASDPANAAERDALLGLLEEANQILDELS